MDLNKVSIICVTWNAEMYLDRCLQSIAEQTYSNIELIIQDGGSIDATLDIIKKWGDLVTYWESVPDEGIYDAMNKALEHITGEWVYFIGADDYLYPEFSDMLMNDLKKKNTVYYANVWNNNKRHDGKYSAYKLCHATINHQAMIYPASVFKKYRFDTKYKICADHLLNMNVFNDKLYSFVFTDRLIAFFSREGVSSSGEEDLLFRKDHRKFVKQYFSIWVYFRFLNKISKKHRRQRYNV